MNKALFLTLASCSLSYSLTTVAQHDNYHASQHDSHLEEMHVLGEDLSGDKTTVMVSEDFATDTAEVLRKIPGANVNSNGNLTGLAQYRGMFGDRVSIALDGTSILSGGPNAMDTPLSYASPLLTKTLSVERGIASASSAAESIGGHIEAHTDRGDFAAGDFSFSGALSSRYNFNGDQSTTAVRAVEANDRHKIAFLAAIDRGDDIETPFGAIQPSELSRDRFDISYGYKSGESELLAYVGRVDTENSGTAALAMDIRFIETDLYGVQWQGQAGDRLGLDVKFSYNDVEHLMDNFGLRNAPTSAMQYRQNFAAGTGSDLRLSGNYKLAQGNLTFGLDSKTAEHDSTITNPNSLAFEVLNFNQVERDLIGVYAEYESVSEGSSWEIGARYNRVNTHSGDIGFSGMMGMMGDAAAILVSDFNASDRDLEFNNLDVVFKYAQNLSESLTATVQLGSKTRAPSYQELYLWLPLQATGGLADGRTYIGNLDLKSERSNEVNLGLEWLSGNFHLAPQVFYKRVDDYIQGVAATDMTANMLSTMMSGQSALQFDNVDAEIYGFDLAMHYKVSDEFYLDGLASYIRGERRDIDDSLYRLAAPSMTLGMNYMIEEWSVRAEGQLSMKQDQTSTYNNESPTSGWGMVNLSARWRGLDDLVVEARLDNLFDKVYQDYLAGVNRVSGAELVQGERLYAAQRSVTLGFTYNF